MVYIKRYVAFTESNDPVSNGNNNQDKTNPVNTNPDKNDQDKVNSDYLKSVQKFINEYNSKKSKVEQIFKQTPDDQKLKLELEKQVYNNQKDVKKRNPYLQEYESILMVQRQIDGISKALNDYMVDKNKTSISIRQFTERLSEESEASQDEKNKLKNQIEINKKHLTEIENGLKFNKQQLSISEKNMQLKKRNFEQRIKNDTTRIKDLLNTQK